MIRTAVALASPPLRRRLRFSRRRARSRCDRRCNARRAVQHLLDSRAGRRPGAHQRQQFRESTRRCRPAHRRRQVRSATWLGPGEYRQAGRLVALTGDSTLLIDATRARRWLILVRDSIVATLPPDWPRCSHQWRDSGADLAGRMLSIRDVGFQKLANDVSRRRMAAVLVTRRTGALDTVFCSVALTTR